MEAKLKEYRALRRRKELIDNTKEKIEKSKQKFYDLIRPLFYPEMSNQKEDEVLLMENEESPAQLQLEDAEDIACDTDQETENIPEEKQVSLRYFITKWTIYSVTWLTLFLFFLKIEFGAVFFVFSALIGIYLNTRTQPKKQGEISAYSVFNENCESIDGTLTAEKLQKEMMFGMLR